MKSVDVGTLSNSVCFSFTPSELAKKLYFYPTWCGHFFCTSAYFMKRKTYPPLLVVYVREGLFHVEYRKEVFDAKKGDVVLLDCYDPIITAPMMDWNSSICTLTGPTPMKSASIF